ncbi:MAG: preprotein translocase subunit SecA [Gemmataceae bacterium]
MSTQTKLEPGLLEKLGDKFNGFMEGSFGFVTRLFGSANDRVVKSIGYHRAKGTDKHEIIAGSILDRVNKLEPSMEALTDEELKNLSLKFRERLKQGETLDDILPEAFAACREAAKRTKNMRHYDVQIVGGTVLHRGAIAEMVTGEGKTLVATLAAYLNALEGKGVHVVTVNDYLARRDCEWMLPIYNALGVSAAYIQSDQDPPTKRHAYECDITYGTNSEFGFDYLRDNMKPARFDDAKYHPYYRQCQRTPLNFAIIDEVDNILIDEARTPLIISGPAFSDVRNYEKADEIARKLTELERKARQEMKAAGQIMLSGHEGDGLPIMMPIDPTKVDPQNPPPKGVYFEIKEKERTCHLTDAGVREAEKLAGVESFYTVGNMEWPHLIDNALRATHMYQKDRHYMIAADPRENNELGIIIIDEFTGRAMFGRQWSDGLHQAVEAKHRREGVKIKQETQTLATVTLQNFCKLYGKVGGMTGTAMTEANEFWKIYKLDVVAVPTNKSLKRINAPDLVYKTEKEKWDAVVQEVAEIHASGRPILIGTTDVAKSEILSGYLKRKGIKHELLNAKPENVAREAEIVAQAGRANAVTISTNMAGRGTDIILGGNPETLAWALLKKQNDADGRPLYPTRLEIPNEVWTKTVDEIEKKDRMKEEGRRIAEQGGLHIVGTERHESRRIDNQLRGRAGRQGDPGSSRFYLSLEDDLMRLFGGERLRRIMNNPWLGLKDGEAIESGMLSRQIEKAQKRVEEYHFDQRKNLLEYDEVMDFQRKKTYGRRQDILDGKNPRGIILTMIEAQVRAAIERYTNERYGASSFAEFASKRFSVEFSGSDFRNSTYEEAIGIAQDKASRMAPTFIVEAMDENLNPDEEEKDWKWLELTRAVNARYGLKLTDKELKAVGRENMSEHILQLAEQSILETDLKDGERFLDRRYGVESLCDWARQKFGIHINLNEIASLEPADLLTLVNARVRETYRAKDLEFPVQVGLAAFLPEKMRVDRKPDREKLAQFAATRFPGSSIPDDAMRTEPRTRIKELLLAANTAYMPKADYPEIDAKIEDALSGVKASEPADAAELAEWARHELNIDLDPALLTGVTAEKARDVLLNAYDTKYRPEMHDTERSLVLDQIDSSWKSHLLTMDHLRSVVGMAGYAQEDPKIIYKREGMKLFDDMQTGVDDRVTEAIFRIEDIGDEQVQSALWAGATAMQASAQTAASAAQARMSAESQQSQMSTNTGNAEPKKVEQIRNIGAKIGRNDPCHCGSGKKYKNCHMKNEMVK